VATIHISELEAARDFSGVMAKVRVGADFVIESENGVVAIVRPPEADFRPRLISECVSEEMKSGAEGEETPVFDAGFGDDLAEIIRNRKPWNPPAWD
jgi:hypothetical protein